MKLRKLHIDNYKMFKDFDISFVDKNDEALPIIVLAGVNGSGKTTLLEFINECNYSTDRKITNNFCEFDTMNGNEQCFLSPQASPYGFGAIEGFEKKKNEHLIYLPAGTDKIEHIKETIRQKYIDRAFEIDKPSDALKELQDYIGDIFQGLALTFNLSSINYNKKEVLFKDNSGIEFDIDMLSTGEKTLLSKVLYLFFKDYQNKVILIDEPELSLHPSWQNKILSVYETLAEKNNCQIIIATHSPHIIGSAKNEYLRILRKNEVVDNSLAYGRDIEWVLEEVMGAQYIREKSILKKIEECEDLINNEKYDEAEKKIDLLEEIIGENDSEILTLRNSLAFERMDFEENN